MITSTPDLVNITRKGGSILYIFVLVLRSSDDFTASAHSEGVTDITTSSRMVTALILGTSLGYEEALNFEIPASAQFYIFHIPHHDAAEESSLEHSSRCSHGLYISNVTLLQHPKGLLERSISQKR